MSTRLTSPLLGGRLAIGGAEPTASGAAATPAAAGLNVALPVGGLAGAFGGLAGALGGAAAPPAAPTTPAPPTTAPPGIPTLPGLGGMLGGFTPTPQPPQPPQPPGGTGGAGPITLPPGALEGLLGGIRPPIILQPPRLDVTRTRTQLARSAFTQLAGAPREQVREAIDTVVAKGVAPDRLMSYLERRVRIGEVLNELTERWSAETVEDFAAAFQMERGRLMVMDLIVDLAVLNDPQLEAVLRAENQPDTTDGDLLDRRQIVWQHPPPGTPLEPPYVMLVAVAYQDVAQADEVVASIIGQLVEFRGFQIPREAAARLR